MKETHMKLVFSIFGNEFPVDEFSNIIGLNPDSKWKKGDKTLSGNNVYKKEDYWAITLESKTELNLDVLSQRLLKIFESKSFMLDTYIKNNLLKCRIEVIAHVYDMQYPSIYFSKEFVAWLSVIGADLDINIY